jgi:hypothetical protein
MEREEEEEEEIKREESSSPLTLDSQPKREKNRKKSKKPKEVRRDMYKVFDGSALMVLGTLGPPCFAT